MKREILAVKKEILFENKNFQGFWSITQKNFLQLILDNFEYVERTDELEKNPDYQQIIPYVWLVNKETKEVFLYKRSKEGDEGRLYDKYSGGVGGHIDKNTEYLSSNPIVDAMMRELKEELTMKNYPSPEFVGFINDDSDEVGKVHFGVVAIANTAENAKPAEHMASGSFFSIKEVEKIFSNPENVVENWTKISWPYVKSYLNSLP